MMYMSDITKYKGSDNKQQKEENDMTTVDKEAMKTGLAGMYANLLIFEDLSKGFEEDVGGGSVDEQAIANVMKVVQEMAQRYYAISKVQYKNLFGEEFEDNGFGGIDRQGQGEQRGDGASVPEAGPERGEVETAEGSDAGGLGERVGEGAEHGSGDRDGHDTDTRE